MNKQSQREIRSLMSLLHFLLLLLASSGCDTSSHIPQGLEMVNAQDGSKWERVNEAGFGDSENCAVVAMAEFKGRLYALVRNDMEGVEVWRTEGKGWKQVLFPGGVTNGIYGNPRINTHMGAITVFKDKLYCGFSSGIQGSYLKSSGCEIWRFDGNEWEPVISDKRDVEESGIITGIAGCEDHDGATTAFIIDETKNWKIDQWAQGVLQITSGEGRFRRFDIIGNTNNVLTIQQNEIAGNLGQEYTICSRQHFQNPFPLHEYDLGMVQVGDRYEIGTGWDENGFGDYWNKTITTMVVFEAKLYVNTCLNYDYGGQVWYTEDGDNFVVTQPPHSLGLFHTDPAYPDAKKPVTRGIPGLCTCDVSGENVLYAGSLGSEGNLGSCARMARLTENGWSLIVDASVDDNDTGTNENGFGDGMECTMFNGNFNVWSMACFQKKLFVGLQSLGGTRILYTPNGSAEDGNWFYSAGGDSEIPNGFDGVINAGASDYLRETVFQNIAVNVAPFKDTLYAGLICLYMPAYGATEDYLTGSQLWKTTDGNNWELVTSNGFSDPHVLTFEAFATFHNTLYLSASRASNTVGGGLGGATIFRLLE